MKIRYAENNDSLDIFTWRNDPISIKMFISNNKVTLEEHKKWFESSLKNTLRTIYIGTLNEEKIGICRFDCNQQMTRANISLNLNPSMRGKGLSYQFLSESIKKYKKIKQIKLTSKIMIENKISLKIFRECGFTIIDQDIKYFHLIEIE
jgi:RimJ/RimL family protein N-acetyltransferase